MEWRLMKLDRLLSWLLKLTALAHLGALAGIFMPASLMATFHARLGLGAFPDAPIAVYLARSLSALYALYGGILWICGTDVRRFAPVITYFSVTGVFFSILITVLDLRAGLPWYWTVGEGPMLAVLCVLILVMQRRMAANDEPAGD
jgi:hypothetical protein